MGHAETHIGGSLGGGGGHHMAAALFYFVGLSAAGRLARIWADFGALTRDGALIALGAVGTETRDRKVWTGGTRPEYFHMLAIVRASVGAVRLG